MKDLLLSYYKKRRSYNTRDYLYDIVSYHITLIINAAKPSSLISLSTINRPDLLDVWELEKENILPEGIVFEEFRTNPRRVNILFYNPQTLINILTNPANRTFLRGLGYDYHNPGLPIIFRTLKERFKQTTFPHEIGLLLGIPLQDVQSFMFFPEKKPLLRGYWKVYTNKEEARKIFQRYDYSKRKYIEHVVKYSKPINPNKLNNHTSIP